MHSGYILAQLKEPKPKWTQISSKTDVKIA